MEHICKFNQSCQDTRLISDEMSMYLGVIRASDELFEQKCFQKTVQVTTFYINLYNLLPKFATNTGNSNGLYHCLAIIEKGMSNAMHRDLICKSINFMPVLINLLANRSDADDRMTILKILLEMSYGMNVEKHEMFLEPCIGTLVNLVQNGHTYGYSETALQVLVNICFRNPICTAVLQNIVVATDFMRSIKSYGVLAALLHLTLSPEEYETTSPGDLSTYTTKELQKALLKWNSAHIWQTTEFMKANMHGIDVDFIETVLHLITTRLHNDSDNETRDTGMNSIFDLLQLFLAFDDCPVEEIQSLVLPWTTNPVTAEKAIALISRTLDRPTPRIIPAVSESFALMLPGIEQSTDFGLKKTFLQLVKLYIGVSNTIPVTDETLETFVKQVLEVDDAVLDDGHVQTFLSVAYIYYLCSDIDTATFYPKFSALLTSHSAIEIFSKCYNLRDELSLALILQLGQCKIFPVSAVAQSLTRTPTGNRVTNQSATRITPQIVHVIPREFEDKVDRLISRITESQTDQLDIAAIEVFQSKIAMYQNTIEKLRSTSDTELVALRHENAILSAESQQSQMQNVERVLKMNLIQKENQQLQKEVKVLNISTANFKKTLDGKKEEYTRVKRQLGAKEAEIEDARRRMKELEEECEISTEQINELKEKVNELKGLLKRNEDQVKQKQKQIDELDGVTTDMTKQLQILNKEKLDLSNLVKEQEKEISLNKQKIQQLASELEEGEEMRKVVMAVMTKKQKKK